MQENPPPPNICVFGLQPEEIKFLEFFYKNPYIFNGLDAVEGFRDILTGLKYGFSENLLKGVDFQRKISNILSWLQNDLDWENSEYAKFLMHRKELEEILKSILNNIQQIKTCVRIQIIFIPTC